MFLFEKLRKNTKIILWVTIFAFVGFIFLVWGMDIQRGGGPNPTIVGKVNGQTIPTAYYRSLLTEAYEQYRKDSDSRISDEEETQLRQTTWDRMVNEVLLQQELRRRNLGASDAEVEYFIRHSPPPEVAQSPAFQTDGKFDPTKYREILANPQYDLSGLETIVRSQVPIRKLEELIASSAKVSDNEVRAIFEDINNRVDYSYIMVNPRAFEVNPDNIPLEQLKGLYDKDPEALRLPESARLRYIVVRKEASALDESEVLTSANDIWREARAGTDFAELARTFSEGAEAAAGGDINRFLDRSSVPAEWADAVFSLKIGEISSPIKDYRGFTIIKLEEKKTEGGVEKVRYRRIFLPVEPSPETIGELHTRLLAALRKHSKASLKEIAQEMGVEPKETGALYKGDALPILPQDAILKEFPFKNRVGTISKPFETQKTWYVFEVVERRDPYVPGFDEALPALKRTATVNIQAELARKKLDVVVSALSKGGSLEQAANAASLRVGTVKGAAKGEAAPGGDRDPALLGAAFSLPNGKVSSVLKGGQGDFFVVRVDGHTQLSEELFAAQKEQMRMQLLQQKRMLALSLWMDQLRSSARIEDYRSEVLGF